MKSYRLSDNEEEIRKKLLAEAGEDDAEESNEAEDDATSDADDAKKDDAGEEGEEKEEKAKSEEAKPEDEFAGLDLAGVVCFGYMHPIRKCWTTLADSADDKGWSNINVLQLESSLMHNVEKCYYSMVSFNFNNVKDDMKYVMSFDNRKMLWELKVADSPDVELTTEQRAGFFNAEIVKKATKQARVWLERAKDVYYKTIAQHIEDGELLSVDVVKLGAIMHWLDLEHFLDNVRDGKYLNY